MLLEKLIAAKDEAMSQKEAAVKDQDFQVASHLRDIVDLLKTAIELATPKVKNPIVIELSLINCEWDDSVKGGCRV